MRHFKNLSLLSLCTFFIGAAHAPLALAQSKQVAQPAPSNAAYDRAPWWMRESVITQLGYVYSEVPANRANFSAEFLAVGDTAEKAQSKAIEQTRALNTALAKLGKDAVRISTAFTMRALYEQYRDKDGNKIENQRGDKIQSYQVSLNLSLEVRDMAVLERAYALVLAAAPTSSSAINFSLQPTNEQNSWLYNQAVKDARGRALGAASAAGASLLDVKVIDPTGRVCETDILGREKSYGPDLNANQVDYRMDTMAMAPPPPPAPAMMERSYAKGSVEHLEMMALKNPFIQTPPLNRIEARACVIYGIK